MSGTLPTDKGRKRWEVKRLGTGTFWFDRIKVLDSGALECRQLVQGAQPNPGAMSNNVSTVMFFGPGMWITAELKWWNEQ